jgi:hypothetical protein
MRIRSPQSERPAYVPIVEGLLAMTPHGGLLAASPVMEPAPMTPPISESWPPEHRIVACVDRSAFGEVCVRYAI